MSDDLRERVALLPCPFCGKELSISKSGMATHADQSQGDCIIGSMGIPTDHPASVAKWNTRADAALAEMGAVRVKPLVWDVVHPVLHHSARNILGKHICSKTNNAHNDRYMVTYLTPTASSETIGYIDGIEAAKAAAQADYEARILAALE